MARGPVFVLKRLMELIDEAVRLGAPIYTRLLPRKDQQPWRFFRAGGVDQVTFEKAEDFDELECLDQKLWIALSCPTKGLEFDTRTLDLIDTSRDGRIRAPEIIEAVNWACARLRDPAALLKGEEWLPLSAINENDEEGKQLARSAREILRSLGRTEEKVCVADTTDTARVFAAMKFNGDGIVPPASADDEATAKLMREIVDCCGAEVDRAGVAGVSQAKLDLFFAEAQAFSDWQAKAEPPHDAQITAAAGAWEPIRAKVDDYFTRVRLAGFDARALNVLNRQEADYAALASKDFSAAAHELAGFPIARIEAGKALPLRQGINPAWSDAVEKFRGAIIPLLGERNELAQADWASFSEKMRAFVDWRNAKAGALVEKLGLERVREILAGPGKANIAALLQKDKALEPEMNAIAAVDRLARYHRDLHRLLRNFVSFAEFYSGNSQAIFQAGRLYLDGRSCDLAVRVADVAKHAALATLSRTYLAYCECMRRGGTDKITIAAAFTAGDADNLMIGRNGLFYDRLGQDWDATIIRIIEHPISLGQAAVAPYKRIARMIGDQIEKFAASRDKAVTDQAASGISQSAAAAAQKASQTPAPPAGAPPAAAAPKQPAPFDAARFAGIFAAIGLAVGALGTAVASVVTGFLKLPGWQMPLALLGVFVVISGPSVLLAWLKLRQRNLGPILDACGWAVNGRVKINIPFGRALTCTAKLPPGSIRSLDDPYKPKSKAGMYVLLAIFLGALAMAVGIWLNGGEFPWPNWLLK